MWLRLGLDIAQKPRPAFPALPSFQLLTPGQSPAGYPLMHPEIGNLCLLAGVGQATIKDQGVVNILFLGF